MLALLLDGVRSCACEKKTDTGRQERLCKGADAGFLDDRVVCKIVGADLLTFVRARVRISAHFVAQASSNGSDENGATKHVEFCVFARRIGARFGAMAQLVDHNRT